MGNNVQGNNNIVLSNAPVTITPSSEGTLISGKENKNQETMLSVKRDYVMIGANLM